VTTTASTYASHLDTLQQGYEAALAAHGYDAVVLCSGAQTSKNRFDDQSWPLSPTPAYSHWVPFAEPDAYVIVKPGQRPTLVRTVVDDFWETPAPPESDHFWPCFELVDVAPGHAGDALPGGKVAVITRDPHASPPGTVNPAPLIAALDLLRTHKSAYEIACIAEATARAVHGHRAVAARFAAGGDVSELELHLAYLGASAQDDAWTPYKNIVALGAHAAVLHYIAYETRKVGGDTSLLVDAGARYLGYGSDITRTYARGASGPAQRFADLVTRMDRLQLMVCSKIKPGMPYEALHDLSHHLLAELLLEAQVCRGSTDELVARGVTRALFPHGLGHSLGVCTHDVGMKPRPPRPDNKFLRNTSTIEIGQVFTIEPGLYVIDALVNPLRGDDRAHLIDWGALDEVRPFGGIRIEDNVLVEAHGVRNLTREAFAGAGS
jgi:Xaa-Pro dipeptidase